MKHEWKKQEKPLYGATRAPALVTAPARQFLTMEGRGNPNDPDFSNRVAALFSLAYAVKMLYRAASNAAPPCGIGDFAVYPLEGIWRQGGKGGFQKEQLEYTIMICQPQFVTAELVQAAFERVKAKKPNPLYEEIRLDGMEDGLCVQLLHTGPYDDEPASFARMAEWMRAHGLTRANDCHREIYLNHAPRTAADKLRTILRWQVKEGE